MRIILSVLSVFISLCSFGQHPKIAGTYGNIVSQVNVTFNQDSSFRYVAKEHPVFYGYEDFSEEGRWALSGDTITLNPQLPKKIFIESGFKEEVNPGDTNLLLTGNHIKRYFDANGQIIKSDTFQITRLDYSFNELKRKNSVRITSQRTTRCAFAGYIPKEIITTSRTTSIRKPAAIIRSIFIECLELQGTKEFVINNPRSNHLTLDVYSNYYQDGEIRQMKFLIKNANVLYTAQKKNGEFEKDNIWSLTDTKLKRQKSRG